jgi:hypothetical protein
LSFQDWGAIGELLGGLAVLITLVYLARQIKQNTAMITAQAVQSSVDATQRVLLFRAEHPEVRVILRKARGNDELNTDELEVLASYLQSAFMNFQARLQHNVRGVFDESVNQSYELILIDYLQQAYVQRWWSFACTLYGDAFREHCDDLIAGINAGAHERILDWSRFASQHPAQGMTGAPDDQVNPRSAQRE